MVSATPDACCSATHDGRRLQRPGLLLIRAMQGAFALLDALDVRGFRDHHPR